jgi:hypothetical protein
MGDATDRRGNALLTKGAPALIAAPPPDKIAQESYEGEAA